MWNIIWVTTEKSQADSVIKRLDELKIIHKKKTVRNMEQCTFEILVPAAETALALSTLADM